MNRLFGHLLRWRGLNIMNNNFLIRYHLGHSFFESLQARTKILFFISSLSVLMVSFDLRIIVPFALLHLVIFLNVRRFSDSKTFRFVLWFTFIMNLINFILFYLFDPLVGSNLANKTTVLLQFSDYFVITRETLIFFLARLLKIFGTLFTSFWLILIITPSQIASGLYHLGVHYKIGTMISLGLRFIPDVVRDYSAIKDAMQMRGYELDAKEASLLTRLKASISILLPLILTSLEKVGTVSSAMDLRGYGLHKKRTYYNELPYTSADTLMLIVSGIQVVIFVFYLYLRITGRVSRLWVW